MADYSDRKTEAELINLEKKLNRLYRRAWNEMRLETEEYFEQFSERYQREYEKYKAGQYTEQQFKAWYQAQVARGKTWEAKRDTLAMQMTHTNEIAAAYVNGTTPSIYALNANYAAYMTEQKYDVSFTLVNEDVIQNLVTKKSNAVEFKTTSVNPVRDYKWNSKQIQSALISGILLGQSIDKLADAFMVVQKRNRNAAVRNARTSVTSAQNAGRIDTMKRSRAMGINTKKEWLSAHDGRVRDSHAALNGQIRDIDEAFDNGLMYPADPDGIPAEVYNCRCTLKYVYPKYQSVQSAERYTKGKQGNESYQEWLKRKKVESVADDEWKRLRDKYGLNVPSREAYMKLRSSDDYPVFRSFLSAVDGYKIDAVASYDYYQKVYDKANQAIKGVTTANGIILDGTSRHLTERIIGYHEGSGVSKIPINNDGDTRKILRRAGVPIEKIIDALTNPATEILPIKENSGGRSQAFVYNDVKVSVNPDTRKVIQVNPYKRKKKHDNK